MIRPSPSEAHIGDAGGDWPCELCHGLGHLQLAMVGPHRLFRCRRCRLVFVRKAGVPRAGEDYYREATHEEFAACYHEFRTREAQRIVAQLTRLGVGTGKSLLDVGCSYGWFLEYAATAGLLVTGIEPSQELVQAAQARGFPGRILVGDVTLLETLDERFDVISFLDVLEHLPEPRRALEAARRLVSPGGILVVRAPNIQGLIHQVALWGYWLSAGKVRVPLEALAQVENDFMHVFFFTPRTLAELLNLTGFRLVHVEGCDIIDVHRMTHRIHLSRQTMRYAAWDHPLVREGIRLLQNLGRWTGRCDEMVAYATLV